MKVTSHRNLRLMFGKFYLLLIFLTQATAGMISKTFRKSVISKDEWFGGAGRSKANFIYQEGTMFTMLSYCILLEWCTCICKESENTFILSDIWVTGAITDHSPGTMVDCLTARGSSLFPRPGMTMTSSPYNTICCADLIRERLSDGVYGHHNLEYFNAMIPPILSLIFW